MYFSARCFWTAQGRGRHWCSRTCPRPTTQHCSSFPRVCVCSRRFYLSVCATISGVIRLCAPSSSLMPLWGPRDPCGSSSTGQDRSVCVCSCVCVWGGGGVRACVWQLVRLVGTLLPDGVGSVANRLGCLKVECCTCHLCWFHGSYTFYLKYTYLLTMENLWLD